jgi:hypothetical protein
MKLGTCTVNVLCQVQVKYYIVKVLIVECTFYIKLKNTDFLTMFV